MTAFRQKYIFYYYGICTILALCFLVTILGVRYIPRVVQPDAPLAAKGAVSFYFDSLDMGKYGTRIEGWAVKQGAAIRTYDLRLLLRAADGTYYALPSQNIFRPDVTAHVNDGKKYDHSGFLVYGLSPALFAQGPFTVYFLYKNNGENLLIDTEVKL